MVRRELENLDKTITNYLNNKQQNLMLDWLKKWNSYLKTEQTFRPHLNRDYSEKEIVTISLGYNVGSEQGGNRPAVVIGDNSHSSKVITVIPLASMDNTNEEVDNFSVSLGEITDLNNLTRKPNGTFSKALVSQIRTISKQRINKPKTNQDTLIMITEIQLQLIKDKISELYVKN
ncbi:type II toxin-antitoxin system PemK/MazF family toxin [Staphylococcus epidermidis]|uniref:type II toxin-antitoxin system PemK/MazF family toxin n=1 Tax=Staphylococcus epidermidis TaxID=1282 RepID=UPI0011A3A5CE|nr:type II toxin-antitoxin system PemK/MazF family toxin [Staphylococcus epidermidis]